MLQTGSSVSTRESIHSAAAQLFRGRGYSRTPVRQIAAEAGTDPALVIRHFKSEELLFLETKHLTLDDEPLLDVPLERLGERLAERRRHPRAHGGRRGGGLLYALWVAGDQGLLRMDRAELVSRYGTLLQDVLTPRTS